MERMFQNKNGQAKIFIKKTHVYMFTCCKIAQVIGQKPARTWSAVFALPQVNVTLPVKSSSSDSTTSGTGVKDCNLAQVADDVAGAKSPPADLLLGMRDNAAPSGLEVEELIGLTSWISSRLHCSMSSFVI